MPLDKTQVMSPQAAPLEYQPAIESESLIVQTLGEYGFQIPSGEWINYSKDLDQDARAKIVPGAQLRCEVYAAKSGKRYVNKVEAVEILGIPPKRVPDPAARGKVRMNAIIGAYASPLLSLRATKPEQIGQLAEQMADHIVEYTFREEVK